MSERTENEVFVGIDVHKKMTQACVKNGAGEVLVEQRMRTTPEALRDFFADWPRARVVLESSTVSELVALALEGRVREVIVADPNFAPMYATASRNSKTDRRDARTLADAARLGAYRAAHRTSEGQRPRRQLLASRDVLIEARTSCVNLVRARFTAVGVELRKVATRDFWSAANGVLPPALFDSCKPLLDALAGLQDQIDALDKRIEQIAETDPEIQRLTSVPGVGPVTAIMFAAIVDAPGRFASAHQLESYLGLVPRELSSGERRRLGSISKAGNSRLRAYLTQCAWALVLSKDPGSAPLRAWWARIEARRGKRIAIVALARKLAGILFAMMRDEASFASERSTRPEGKPYVLVVKKAS